MNLFRFRSVALANVVGLVMLSTAVVASADAAPTIMNVAVRGLQIEGKTVLTIDGADLLPDSQIISSVPLAQQTVQPGATLNRLQIEVIVAGTAQPGIYYLWLANAKGISNPVAVGVDRLPQQPFVAEVKTLPVALHGVIVADQRPRVTFVGKKGEHVVIDVESQRLGASLKPVLRLYDARGVQVAWSAPRASIGGDARIDVTLPADGSYTVELHDVLYRAAGPGFFRLKIGDLTYADLVYPAAVAQGAKVQLEFVSSNLPTGAKAEFDATTTVPTDYPAVWPVSLALTAARPRMTVSEHAEIMEAAPVAGQLQTVAPAPIGISGRIAAPNEEDRYLLTVTPGSKLQFDVIARRTGSPLDGVFTILGEQGNPLASNDDRPGTSDPGLDFNVPANVNKLMLAVRDLHQRGGPDFVYRLVVRDLSRPDFGVTLGSDRINIPAGGTQLVQVTANRTGYNGPLEFAVNGLPTGVQVAGHVLAPGATMGLLTFTAPAGAPVFGRATISARATDSQVPIVRIARTAESNLSKLQPWLREEVGLAVTEPGPLAVAWTSASADEKLPLGGKLPAKLTMTRAANVPGNVRIRLVSTQITPKKTVKQNNVDVQVDDVDRTLRLEGTPMLAPDANETVVNILVPPDLPALNWGLVLVAELLAADNKTVTFVTSTAFRALEPVVPFTIELAGPPAAEGKSGTGDTGKFAGKINRIAGFNAPVTVTLAALPDGFAPPKVDVPADKNEFVLPLSFPSGTKLGELKNVKLVATAAPDPKNAALVVRSNELLVAINIVMGEKPKGEQPREIFEDDEKFVSLLTQGAGQASLEANEKHSGKVSLKVTPDQRFNDSLPNLGVKIREKPGPGEFRYLRFAWKKKGGQSICLQLNHDGTWGPGGSGKPGAKFRYHAGPGGECYGGSEIVDQKLPEGFVVVSRDLFADFGEFTLNGLAFSPVDGEYALFDQIYLARATADFESLKP